MTRDQINSLGGSITPQLRELAFKRLYEGPGDSFLGFHWVDTPEGFDFWARVRSRDISDVSIRGIRVTNFSYKPALIQKAKFCIGFCRNARKNEARKLTDTERTDYLRALKIVKNIF